MSNFFRAFCISGAPADLGFDCPTCHQAIRYGLVPGQTVEHCGKREPVPDTKYWSDLECKSLKRGMPPLPKGYQLLECFSTLENNDWEIASDKASFDPGAYEIPWV